MEKKGVKCCATWTIALVILVLAFLLLLGVIGLAALGIYYAQVADDRYEEAIESDEDRFEYYWLFAMAASSGCGLLLCVFGSLAIIALIKACRSSRTEEPDEADGDHEMRHLSSEKEDKKGETKNEEILLVEGESLIAFKEPVLESLSCSSMITLFVSVFFLNAALLCMLWGIAIAYDNTRRQDKTITVYVIVDVVVGLGMPILLVLSLLLQSIFLEYITGGQVDARVGLTKLLPGVKLVKTKTNQQYWSIQDRFFFMIKQHDSKLHLPPSDRAGERISCSNACSHTFATWILTSIVALSFLLAATYFMNSTITEQVTLATCPHESYEVDCFNKTTYDFINCSDPNFSNATFELLHCFRFLEFGISSDPIGALSRSFAFYLATIGFFAAAFNVVKILILFKATVLWGIGFVILGILAIGVGLFVMLSEAAVMLRLNVIAIFQFYMAAIFVVLVGVLMLHGKWKEVTLKVVPKPYEVKHRATSGHESQI